MNKDCHCLIRHGDRDKHTSKVHSEMRFNAERKGEIHNSLKFGESLAELKVNRIFTSPVGRCVQTADSNK
jgi:broad specificity phosphatase PhoE